MSTGLGFGLDISLKNVFEKINQLAAFHCYCTTFKEVDTKFKSELRNDTIPSCVIYQYNDKLYYKDFGENLPPVDCVGYVQRKFHTDLYSAMKKINRDLGLDLEENSNFEVKLSSSKEDSPKSELKLSKKPKDIQVEIRKFTKKDAIFWSSYGITKSTLQLYHVFPISWFCIDNVWYKADELAYCYHYYKNQGSHLIKIYQPHRLNGNGKWYTNANRTVVQGEGVLSKSGELLIITKALKDVMVLRELGYEAIAPNSETVLLPVDYVEKQKLRFNNLVVFFDNDTGGINGKESYITKWPWMGAITIPLHFQCKDISDLSKSIGLIKAKEVLINLLYGRTDEEESARLSKDGKEDTG